MTNDLLELIKLLKSKRINNRYESMKKIIREIGLKNPIMSDISNNIINELDERKGNKKSN
jgi:hypothetical protein